MSFSVKQIKALLSENGMPIENLDKAAEEICGRHSADLDSIKEQRDNLKKDAETFAEVKKELDALKANRTDDYKEMYTKEHEAFEKYKSEINAKETKVAKENAVKAYFEGKNISGKNLEIAMRGCGAEIAALELSDGKIKDTKSLDDLVNGTFAGLVGTTRTEGADTRTPPGNGAGGKKTMTRDEILAIKDTATRQKAIAENPSVFGI